MRTNLSEATFIIPIRIESSDRMRNVITTTAFLLENFKTNIIIKEVDKKSIFEKEALPILEDILDVDLWENFNFIFEESDEPLFHRQRVLNEMIMECETDIVVNYDCDVILPKESYELAYKGIMDNIYDVVYPYRFGKQGERKVKLDFTIRSQEDMNNFENYPEVKKFTSSYDPDSFENYFYYPHQQGEGWAEYGMVQFFDRKVYMNGFLENEGFIAYAPEDVERHHRWGVLGYNIGRVDNYAYHLEHERTQNSWFHNPHMQRNNELWEQLKVLNKEQLTEYYQQQDYVKERLS